MSRLTLTDVRNADAEFDGYVVERPLGRGGSANVYLAHRPPDEAPVALKVLADDHRDAADLERLHREFGFARQFDHPHIVKVYERGPHWLAMQYVDGGNAGGLATLDQRLDGLAQIAGALTSCTAAASCTATSSHRISLSSRTFHAAARC